MSLSLRRSPVLLEFVLAVLICYVIPKIKQLRFSLCLGFPWTVEIRNAHTPSKVARKSKKYFFNYLFKIKFQMYFFQKDNVDHNPSPNPSPDLVSWGTCGKLHHLSPHPIVVLIYHVVPRIKQSIFFFFPISFFIARWKIGMLTPSLNLLGNQRNNFSECLEEEKKKWRRKGSN